MVDEFNKMQKIRGKMVDELQEMMAMVSSKPSPRNGGEMDAMKAKISAVRNKIEQMDEKMKDRRKEMQDNMMKMRKAMKDKLQKIRRKMVDELKKMMAMVSNKPSPRNGGDGTA